MDIKAGIQTAIVLVILGALLSVWAGIQSIRSGRKLAYFRLRQKRIETGWRLFFFAALLAGLASLVGSFGEPVAYQFYPPSPTPSLTPTITMTPTITLTPTISMTPTITNTPSISDTPTNTSTPFLPQEIQSKITSLVTPNPDAIFSPLTFARGFDPTTYQPVEPGPIFQNPIKRLVAIYSYDKMLVGAQWTAVWYRDGTIVHYETKPWDGTTGGNGFADWAPDPSAWLPGNYQVQIFVGLDWKVVGRFTVQGKAPTPQPSARPSATITLTGTRLPSPTPGMTATPFPTLTPVPSNTKPPTSTPKPSPTRAPSDTPWPSSTPTPTRTPTPSYTPRPTDTPWPTPK